MINLCFALPAVLTLAEHALAAPGHERSYARRSAGPPAVASLAWVKDDGTYLLSNGIPGLRVDRADPRSPQVSVEAEGWGSGTRQELGRIDEIGGDHFVEYIELGAGSAGERLIDQLRSGAQRRLPWLVLTVFDLTTFDWVIPAIDGKGAQR